MAQELRSLLWEKDVHRRMKLNIKGRGFNLESHQLGKLISVPGSWVIGVVGLNDSLLLLLITPGSKLMVMMLSDEPALWEHLHFDPRLDGIIHIVNASDNKVRLNVPLSVLMSESVCRANDEAPTLESDEHPSI